MPKVKQENKALISGTETESQTCTHFLCFIAQRERLGRQDLCIIQCTIHTNLNSLLPVGPICQLRFEVILKIRISNHLAYIFLSNRFSLCQVVKCVRYEQLIFNLVKLNHLKT